MGERLTKPVGWAVKVAIKPRGDASTVDIFDATYPDRSTPKRRSNDTSAPALIMKSLLWKSWLPPTWARTRSEPNNRPSNVKSQEEE